MADEMWRIEDDENGDVCVVSPDNHRFYFGNMEGTSKCCFDTAQVIVDRCNSDDAKLLMKFRKLIDEVNELLGAQHEYFYKIPEVFKSIYESLNLINGYTGTQSRYFKEINEQLITLRMQKDLLSNWLAYAIQKMSEGSDETAIVIPKDFSLVGWNFAFSSTAVDDGLKVGLAFLPAKGEETNE